MNPIRDRETGEFFQEQVFGEKPLRFLYSSHPLASPLRTLTARLPLISWLYGWWQRQPWTRHYIAPFVKKYNLDPSEFAEPLEAFPSFDAFFTRKLKPESRPFSSDPVIIPADGRYLAYPHIPQEGLTIKGQTLSIEQLLGDSTLARTYLGGSLVIGRLCPTDYHRFHFPCACTPGQSRLLNGWLYSVNPLALAKRLSLLTENKRTITPLKTNDFGTILTIEVGATNVGSIHQTYTPHHPVTKGDEKGFFSFGGSTLILLFEPNTITLSPDLTKATADGIETRCLLGQSLCLTT